MPISRRYRTAFRQILLTLPLWTAALFILAAPAWSTKLVRVTPGSKFQQQQLFQAAPELRDCGTMIVGDSVEFPADDAEIAKLTSLGFTVDTMIDDLEAFYRSRLDRSSDYGGYHNYVTAIAQMDSLAAAHANIMSAKQSIGTTIEGRTIWVYKISSSPNANNGKPAVFFNAYIHAREPIGYEVVFDLAKTLCNGYGNDPRMSNIVNNRQVWIEPVVNPDGVEYNHLTNPNGGGMWRKNRRLNSDGSYGVDLNRNFSYEWGYDNNGSSPYPDDDTYRGTGPFSEPESAAMRDFIYSHPCLTELNYHSYADVHIFPWGYDDIHTVDFDAQMALAERFRANSGYNIGTSWEEEYLVNGECTDWMYGEQTQKAKIMGLLTEVGNDNDGFWPPTTRIAPLVAENHEANLRLCELADDPYRALPPGLSAVTAPDTVGRNFILTWNVPKPDPDNPATAWNLIEATGASQGADNLEESNVTSRWATDGWTLSTARSKSGTHSYWGGNGDDLNNTLTSKRGHLVKSGEQLTFWTWYQIETNYDYGYVELTTDGRTYTRLPGNITTNNDPNQRNVGNGITGTSSNWVQATFDLSAYVGKVVWVRFRYSTDGGTSYAGWFVDDIAPADLFLTETTVATNLTSPQYTFNNHPLGTYSYLVQSVDAEGDMAPWGVPAALTVFDLTSVATRGSSTWPGLELAQSNPFSGGAVLRYIIPSSARAGDPVQLAVFDVNGREVALLQTGQVGSRNPPGLAHEDRWTPGGVPSGLYFARLSVGGRQSTRQLVYLK